MEGSVDDDDGVVGDDMMVLLVMMMMMMQMALVMTPATPTEQRQFGRHGLRTMKAFAARSQSDTHTTLFRPVACLPLFSGSPPLPPECRRPCFSNTVLW